MYPIPAEDDPARERMLAEHAACTEMMRGVAGFAVVRTERPGSAIGPHGGILADQQLNKVLRRMRAQEIGAFGGKYVIICTKVEKEWRIGRLSGVAGVPPTFVDDRVFDNENDVHHAIFELRFEQYPERDGMPEHIHEGWKRRNDNWALS
jgi:hypothetical protein